MKDPKYDADLQMVVSDEPAVLDLNHLGFLRWLGDHGWLEHPVAGPPCGPLVAPTFDDVEVAA